MNWREVVRETILAILALCIFIPTMIVIYGYLAQ